MKQYKNIFLGFVAMVAGLFTTDCSNEIDPVPNNSSESFSKVTISGSVDFPEMPQALTRALGEDPSSDLNLYLLVFDDTGLTEVVVATDVTYSNKTFSYKASITETDTPTKIHFIAISDSNKSFYKTLQDLWGPETLVMRNLTTSNGQDAYWQRIDLNKPVKKDDSDLATNFTGIKLIRNFAKVSIESKANPEMFTLEGFEVVNVLQSGTIAPMLMDNNGNVTYVDFVTNNNKSGKNYYHWIVDEQGYTGRRAISDGDSSDERWAQFKEDNLSSSWDFNSNDKYFYERPFLATNHIYVIVKGKFGSYDSSYYKVDLGETDSDGIFTYYNLLRNINYHIVIKSVEATGSSNPVAAAQMAASNNLCAAVETISQSKVTDGDAMLEVNATTFVSVDTEPIVIKYRYSDMNTGAYSTSDVAIKYITGDEIVVDWSETKSPGEDGWYNLTLKPTAPTDALREQSFVLYKSGGLSRKITLISRHPWEFGNVSFTGTTVRVTLPAGLPDAMFPLVLTFKDESGHTYGSKKIYLSQYKENQTVTQTLTSVSAGTAIYVCNPYFTDKKIN